MLYHRIQKENSRLETNIKSIEKLLSTLPKGNLICSKNGSYYKWFHYIGKKRTYIPKSNRELAEKLALKKYLSLELKEQQAKKLAIDCFLNHYPKSTNDNTFRYNTSKQLLSNIPEFKNLLHSQFQTKDEQLRHWQNEDYSHNPKYPEQLIHKTISGNMVRSKSEVMIDMLLYKNNIPFRYECALQLGQHTFYPDFTIRHPQTRAFFYWEHFGMMDDPAYYKNVYQKLHTYTSFGIIPNIHLITTYETAEYPLSMNEIENIIEKHFL